MTCFAPDRNVVDYDVDEKIDFQENLGEKCTKKLKIAKLTERDEHEKSKKNLISTRAPPKRISTSRCLSNFL